MAFQDHRIAVVSRLLLLMFVVVVGACKKSQVPSTKVFTSPEDAGQQLLGAAKSGDEDALLAIFGPGSEQVIRSGDPVQDKAMLARFVSAYEVMHRWRKAAGGDQIMLVGADNFAFPIPLKQNAGGQWFFDTAAGKDELLSRRIGRNELAAIGACAALADAQGEYFSQMHGNKGHKQYAEKIISDPGQQNGLYWDASEGRDRSPLGPLVAFASTEGYSVRTGAVAPFHGYMFKMLKSQSGSVPGGARDYAASGKMAGGFGFVAYPAQYGNSGVMTFIINQDGRVFQRDLGKETSQIAGGMTVFDPSTGWVPAG